MTVGSCYEAEGPGLLAALKWRLPGCPGEILRTKQVILGTAIQIPQAEVARRLGEDSLRRGIDKRYQNVLRIQSQDRQLSERAEGLVGRGLRRVARQFPRRFRVRGHDVVEVASNL